MAPFLALTGFMGSGKTTVGAGVADLLGWRFLDLDEELVVAEGSSVPEFFAVKGEAAFRVRECELLTSILGNGSTEDGLVLALGGGTLESAAAATLLKGRGVVAYLEVEPAQAWARVQESARPLARERRQFEALLTKRRAAYEDLADWVVPVADRSAEDLAREIAQIVRATGRQRTTPWVRQIVSTDRPSMILGGEDALRSLEEPRLPPFAPRSRLFVITDENVMRALGDRVLCFLGDAVPPEGILVLEVGESNKSVRTLERCWNWLAERGARRDDTVVALGGGVVGDLAGFAAATYQRGVSLWQIPTSLLAQVDSSVGGKTGVNLGAGKNLVGAFYQPDLVIIDPATLRTLPDPEYINGLGEVVKYGLLESGDLFAKLENDSGAVVSRAPGMMADLVKTCVAYKARVVEGDERDSGRRAVLNLGHTTAHALELTMGYGVIRHGRAVGLGLLVALAVSERLLGLDRSVRDRTRRVLVDFGLRDAIELPDVDALLKAASRDKKAVAGTSGFVGLRSIGDPVWALDVPSAVFAEALEVIRA
ncbi:MAG: 3-dehydroquinate synthase [bacterium]